MKNKIISLVSLLIVTSALCFGQGTALTTTTISSAMTNTQNTVVLASGTGVTIPGAANQINTVLFIDRELMRVTGLVSGTTYNVQRGIGTRQTAHLSAAKVWLGAPIGNFSGADYFAENSGSCTATASITLPQIYVKSSHKYDCLGGQWVLTSGMDYPVVGSTVASPAGLLTATGNIFVVSGTNAITGINVPNGFADGMSLYLVPSGAFTTTTATNIALASTGVVNKTLIMTWNSVTGKWTPSY